MGILLIAQVVKLAASVCSYLASWQEVCVQLAVCVVLTYPIYSASCQVGRKCFTVTFSPQGLFGA